MRMPLTRRLERKLFSLPLPLVAHAPQFIGCALRNIGCFFLQQSIIESRFGRNFRQTISLMFKGVLGGGRSCPSRQKSLLAMGNSPNEISGEKMLH